MKQRANVMEVVTFKVDSTLSDSEVTKKLESLTQCANSFDGFVNRKFGKSENGEWIDIVYWETLEHAEIAAKKIMEDPKAQQVFAIIDNETMKFSHYKIK